MYDIAKKAREGMKGKARRLASQNYERVDSSTWTPPEPLNAGVKTGMRPVSKQALKNGGEASKKRADRVARKAGGKVEAKGEQPLVDRWVNRDLKKANEYRDGIKHDGGMKKGGRAKRQSGGMTMEEMIKNNPAPKKEPEFKMPDRVPLPPRRKPDPVPPRDYKKADPRLIVAAKGGKIKHSDVAEDKKLIKKMVKPTAIKKADGGPAKKSAWDMSPSEMLESSRKRDEDTKRGVEESKKKYPGMSAIERAEQAIKDRFNPAYFKKLRDDRKKELDEDTGYQEFAERRSKKADGGPTQVDPRLGIVKPKMLQFGQDVVTPGLKRGGRTKKEAGGPAREAGKTSTQAMQSAPVAVKKEEKELPKVGSGILPNSGYKSTPGPVYDPEKYNEKAPAKSKRTFGESMMDMLGQNYSPLMGGFLPGGREAKKGGRIKKQIGGALGNRPLMPSMPQQAMANAQGVPFQSGTFSPPGLSNRPQMPTMPTMPSQAVAGAPVQPQMPQQAQAFLPSSQGGQGMYAKGGRVARAEGGKTSKAKGKTHINIVINAKPNVGDMGVNQPNTPPMPPMGAGAPPMPIMPSRPPMPPAAPMMGGAGPAPGPQMAGVPRPGGFKRGGKVYRSYKDMDAGAGSGVGRLEKTEIASRSAKKAGGKVYRSYKDMDAGAGSGLGRMEKTEIQKRKK